MIHRLLTLSAGNLKLTLCPAVGGCIARFDFIDGDRIVPVLRGCDGVPGGVLAAASFPLVPYVNRIRGGQFTFRGKAIRLRPNMPGDPSPLHGQGWLGAWRLVTESVDGATLEYEHDAGEWPWPYLATQRFRLDEAGLRTELTCRNLSAEPMPCGLGQHPYFQCSAGTRLQTKVDHVWTIDDQVLPIERVAATGRFDLADRPVCGLGLDHGFGGWGGVARLSDPAWPCKVEMSSSEAEFFQLYSPLEGGIFVIEPVTHANAALNAPEEEWPGLGIRVLMPDAEMTLTMRLEILNAGPAAPD